MSAAVHLDEASVEALAQRVAELLRNGNRSANGKPSGDSPEGADTLVDTAEVARRFNVSRAYVYEHADDLGAVRLGEGPRARLRFDPAVAAERFAASRETRNAVTQSSAPRRRKRSEGNADLLPIRGKSQ
jgi:hypothetical protein